MLSYIDFKNKWLNQKCLILPSSIASGKGQCFDLVVAWTDNLGIPHYPGNPSPFPYQNAYQIYTDYGSWQQQYFDRIYNSVDAIPHQGDILVFSSYYNNGAGHTALCESAAQLTLNAFSQNDPTGALCITKNYNYNYILGWLRPKTYSVPQTSDQLIKSIKDNINGSMGDSEFRNWERKLLGV